MKRTADAAGLTQNGQSVPLQPIVTAFTPDATALLDPKAYFAQWQQAATSGVAAVPAAPPPMPVGGDHGESSELMAQIQPLSAVKCAALVKEKGANFPNAVAIEALYTMSLKSSFKLREELLKHAHVRKLCERVQRLLAKPPPGLSIDLLGRASWSLLRFPNEALGKADATLGGVAQVLSSAKPGSLGADSSSKVLWSLAKADVIGQHKQLVSKVVGEIAGNKGRRVSELSHEGMIQLCWAVARSRRHIRQGDHTMIRMEANDEMLFQYAAKRIMEEIDKIDAKLLADHVHTHAEIGIKNVNLFKAICPKLLAKQKDLDEKTMGKAIKAYARFMIPLTEEAQGFRTLAVVAKGDFIRPSDKPVKVGPKQYDKPQALFPKPQVHGRD